MTNEQVMQLFEAGSQWATGSRLAVAAGRLIANPRTDKPFTLAARIETVDGESAAILANGDNAASERVPGGNWENGRTQQNLFDRMRNMPRVPFSALNMAGLPLEAVRLVDFTPDVNGTWVAAEWAEMSDTIRADVENGVENPRYQNREGYLANADGTLLNANLETADDVIPMGAVRTVHRSLWVPDDNGPDMVSGERGHNIPRHIDYHRVGTVVLRLNEKDYLCAMDERQYFISLLPEQVADVSGAFAALAPDEVKSYIRERHVNPRRQGEWFFIPVDAGFDATVKLTDIQGNVELPRESEQSNLHVASEGIVLDGTYFVRGEVKHLTPDGSEESGEHRDLFLGPQWHRVAKNTSVADWTVPQDSSREPMVD